MKRWSVVAVASLALAGCAATAEVRADDQRAPLERDLAELMAWFPGVYENHVQVYRQAVERAPDELRHRHTHHTFAPVEVDFIVGETLYAQQYQHYDPADVYRQRIYAFTVDTDENAIRLTIHTPKEPERLLDAHLNPAVFDAMSADDFVLKPGCEVFWTREEDGFHGYLKENACSYYSTRFETQVFLNETLILRDDALILHDTAVDADGAPVFGAADRGPSINLKQRP